MFIKNFNEYLDADTGLELAGSEDTGVEEQEIADPDVEESEGEEEVETAEPLDEEEVTNRTDTDSAFAQLRREKEAAEKRAKQLEESLGLFFDGDGDEKIIQAKALYAEKSPEEVRAEMEEQARIESIVQEKEALEERLLDLEVENQMASDLKELQGIDPKLKSLDDLGPTFFGYIEKGLPAVDAYFATKAKESATKYEPPKAAGKVNAVEDTKDYYTQEEVDLMSDEEIAANLDKINKSMTKW